MEKDTLEVGIIGMGDMGRLYAKKLRESGWKHINVCDRPEQYEQLREDPQSTRILLT